MRNLRVAFKTLGCKLNQLETEAIADSFAQAGAEFVDFDAEADLYVVNTCTVTGKAEQKARRVIRQAMSRNPLAVTIVTGCYAQVDPEGLSLLHPRSVVVSGDEKSALLQLAAWLHDNWQGHGDLFDSVIEWRRSRSSDAAPDRFAFHPSSFAFHSRPSLKIEDGCDNRCSYCRVCLARGPARSLEAKVVLERVQALEAAGKGEVVLTGVNLSQYDDGRLDFPGLLHALLDNTSRIRFRISSYEPERIGERFLEAFARDRVQPHVHLAAQSGSTAVLRRMARRYDAEKILYAVDSLRAVKDDPFLAADIIAGFPGETEAEFEETMALCRQAGFAWIHAFPFSARPGTRAFDMKLKVPERVAGERVARLSELAGVGKAEYVTRWVGREIEAIVEKSCNRCDDDEVSTAEASVSSEPEAVAAPGAAAREGTSSNYLKLRLAGLPDAAAPGASIRALLTAPAADRLGIDAEAAFAGYL